MTNSFNKAPAAHVIDLVEGLVNLGGEVPPAALRSVELLHELAGNYVRADVHNVFFADLRDRAVTATLAGEPFPFAEQYVAGCPAPLSAAQLRDDHADVLLAAQTAVRDRHFPALSAELGRLHLEACADLREHVGLIGVLESTRDSMDLPPEVHVAREAVAWLGDVLDVASSALWAYGARRKPSVGNLGPHTEDAYFNHLFREVDSSGGVLPATGSRSTLAALRAVNAGPTWLPDELVGELLHITRVGHPSGGWLEPVELVTA